MEIDRNKIYNVILWFIINEKLLENYRSYRRLARFKPSGNMDRAYTSIATPTLDHFAYDLTAAAKAGRLEFCVAQEETIEKVNKRFNLSGKQFKAAVARLRLFDKAREGQVVTMSDMIEVMYQNELSIGESMSVMVNRVNALWSYVLNKLNTCFRYLQEGEESITFPMLSSSL